MQAQDNQLGSYLRRQRKRARLTQRAAARKLGVTNVHLCNVERGAKVPSPQFCARAISVYGCSGNTLGALLLAAVAK